jgi:hypothetical protein
MYNCLPSIYTNAEKLRDEIEIIRWSKQNLVALIGYRILSFLPDRMRANLNFKSAIDILFEPDVLEFVIERTLYRPREIIQACNDCLDVFKNAPFHGLSHNGKINLEIAKQAIQKFSSYKISDLSEEYSTEYPRIIDFFKLCLIREI